MEEEDTFKFGWIIVGVSFIILALSYGVWYSFSVFFVALLKEFSWSRSTAAGAFSLFVIIHSIIGPFVGGMVDRFGPRRLILLGSLFLGAGLALSSLIQTWMQFYIFFGVITAVGVGANGWVPNTTIIQHRFKERRGLAMGIISSGVGFGILVCVPFVQLLITRLGWRTTYRIMAFFIPLIIASMAILFLKRQPTTLCRHTEVLRSVMKDPSIIDKEWASRSWTVRRAITTKHFCFLSLFFFLGTLVTQSILTHHVAFFVDQGLETLFASYIAGMVGIVSMGGKILWGSLSDKIGREITYTIGVACTAFGITFLIGFHILSSPIFPYFYAFFFGMGYAVSATLAPLITADFFGGRAYGSIFGTLSILNGVGGAFGAWFAGFFYDHVRSYVPFFIIMIACALFACLIVWIAAPRKISIVPGKKVLRLKRSEAVESSKKYQS